MPIYIYSNNYRSQKGIITEHKKRKNISDEAFCLFTSSRFGAIIGHAVQSLDFVISSDRHCKTLHTIFFKYEVVCTVTTFGIEKFRIYKAFDTVPHTLLMCKLKSTSFEKIYPQACIPLYVESERKSNISINWFI